MGTTQMNTAANAGEVFSDSDEEMDEETRERHKEFERKRDAHYSREAAFAMRKARELEEDEEEDEEGGDEAEGGSGGANGTRGSRSARKPNGVVS